MAKELSVVLERSEHPGFGFSLLGKPGLPPIIYHILEDSPAAESGEVEVGDVILKVNETDVNQFTTKEVLKCLRLSSDPVTLRIKRDPKIKATIRKHLSAWTCQSNIHNHSDCDNDDHVENDSLDIMSITSERYSSGDDLKSGIDHHSLSSNRHTVDIASTKIARNEDAVGYHRNSNGTCTDTSKQLENHQASDENERLQWGPLGSSDAHKPKVQPKFEAFMMTGEHILNISRMPQQPIVPKLQKKNNLRYHNSHAHHLRHQQQQPQTNSVPNSPNESDLSCSRKSPESLTSSLCSLSEGKLSQRSPISPSSANYVHSHGHENNDVRADNTQCDNNSTQYSCTTSKLYEGGSVRQRHDKFVRASRSEDPLQGNNESDDLESDNNNRGAIVHRQMLNDHMHRCEDQSYCRYDTTHHCQINMEDELATSLNTLLVESRPNSSAGATTDSDRIVWTYNAPPSAQSMPNATDISPQSITSPVSTTSSSSPSSTSPTSMSSSLLSSTHSGCQGRPIPQSTIHHGGGTGSSYGAQNSATNADGTIGSYHPVHHHNTTNNGDLSLSEAMSNISSPDYHDDSMAAAIRDFGGMVEASDASDSDSTLLVSEPRQQYFHRKSSGDNSFSNSANNNNNNNNSNNNFNNNYNHSKCVQHTLSNSRPSGRNITDVGPCLECGGTGQHRIVIQVKGTRTADANTNRIMEDCSHYKPQRSDEEISRSGKGSDSAHNSISGQNNSQLRTSNNANSPERKLNSMQSVGDIYDQFCDDEDQGTKDVRSSSPHSSEDESDIESLHSFHYSPKAVDMPSAIRLAKRLYFLDGFKKSDVSRHLSKNNDFSRAVAEEYLNYFNFESDTLDVALRKFLKQFSLTGETQERERVLVHFSKRFLDCNQGSFNSQDAVHTLTCAIMLLNTDLHGQNVSRKMTCPEFIENLTGLNENENFPREVLKQLYFSIRHYPLEWALDEDAEDGSAILRPLKQADQAIAIGSNPFLEAPSATNSVEYQKGYVMRKCCFEANAKKTPFHKRSWKMFYCTLKDLVLYLHKDENGFRKSQLSDSIHNAIRIHHALATKATDYKKKQFVFRLQTSDQAEYLFQTSNNQELQAWIDSINFVSARFSASPLEAAVGSQKKFQRPLLPCSHTKLNWREQLQDHETRLLKFEAELVDHRMYPPEKGCKPLIAQNYREKEAYLNYEIKRYKTYVHTMYAFAIPGGRTTFQCGDAGFGVMESRIGECDETSPVESSSANKSGVVRSPQSAGIVGPYVAERSSPPTNRYSYRQAIYNRNIMIGDDFPNNLNTSSNPNAKYISTTHGIHDSNGLVKDTLIE